MKNGLLIIGSVLLLSSCTKDKLNCTAHNSNGEAMYEVVGSELCEDQIKPEEGQYCNCQE